MTNNVNIISAVDLTEETILGALLLERDAIANVIDILKLESFQGEERKIIYQSVLDLYDRNEPIDLITITNDLRKKGKLDFIGGAYYLTELTTKVSSAANIRSHAYYLQEESAKQFLKELGATLWSYMNNPDKDVHKGIELVESYVKKINERLYRGNKENLVFKAKLESLLFNPSLIVPDPTPIISIDKKIIASLCNLVVFVGASKVGKSGLLYALISGAIAQEGFCLDTCGLTIARNTQRKLVLYIDSEQSLSNFYKAVRSILKRSELNNCPDFLKAISIRELSIEERKKALEYILEKHSAMFGGVHLIVIDGIADFVSSVNDEQECNEIVAFFEKLAIKYNCPIVTVLHLNPSSENKSRGHLGSQLERKAESILTIKQDKETKISTLSATYLRNAGNVPDIEFRYDIDKGYHVACEFSSKKTKDIIRTNELRLSYQSILQDGQLIVSYKDLISIIKEHEAVSSPTAKRRIAEMKKLEIIENTNDTNGGIRYIKYEK